MSYGNESEGTVRIFEVVGKGDPMQPGPGEPAPISDILYGGTTEKKPVQTHQPLAMDKAKRRAEIAAKRLEKHAGLMNANMQYQPNVPKAASGAFVPAGPDKELIPLRTSGFGEPEAKAPAADLNRFDRRSNTDALPTLKSSKISVDV